MNQKNRFGELPPQYGFMLNPYPDIRVSKCPSCDKKTGQRKLPLVIHIDPRQLISLNYTCRYCKVCDLLIGHKDQIEHLLTEQMRVMAPEMIGNDYLILGTMERKAWKANLENPKPPHEMLAHIAGFETMYEELRVTQVGWFPKDVEPGIQPPPPSREWVKR